jgi:hypothetical protein
VKLTFVSFPVHVVVEINTIFMKLLPINQMIQENLKERLSCLQHNFMILFKRHIK